MTLLSRVERLEQAAGERDGDWVEIPYGEYRWQCAQHLLASLRDSAGEGERKAPSQQRSPEEEVEAGRRVTQLLEARLRAAREKERAHPSTKWVHPHSPRARFFVRRDVYEALPPLEAAEPKGTHHESVRIDDTPCSLGGPTSAQEKSGNRDLAAGQAKTRTPRRGSAPTSVYENPIEGEVA